MVGLYHTCRWKHHLPHILRIVGHMMEGTTAWQCVSCNFNVLIFFFLKLTFIDNYYVIKVFSDLCCEYYSFLQVF